MPGSAADLPSVAEVIEAALPTARWFAGKHRRAQVRAIVGLPAISDDDLPVVSLEIAEVIDPDAEGPAEHYLLPLCYRSPSDPAGPGLGVARHPRWGPVAVHEASTDPYAGDVFLQLLSTPTDLTEDPHLLRCRVLDTSSLRPGLPARAFGGEQSNTSVLYADRALLKFFRRLEFGGENLDIEVHRELAGGPARGRLAGLMSWLSAEWIDSTGHARAADLGMLVEQVRGAADGWDLAVDQVLRGADFSAYAAELGHALRDVHTGLADAFGT
ncbi:MAG: hypothetical protein Q4G46_11335, partial [Propionibacteriaceae bacterium]|nr:hypothetical protein [Propionibacteriaceae bacterium]